jgi:3-dehydroquinate synthase
MTTMGAVPRDSTSAAAAGRVRVEVGAGRDYDILLGAGLLTEPKSFAAVAADVVAVVVSNITVAPLYAAALVGCLRTIFRSVALVELADGEEHKTWQTAERIVDALLAAHADRKTVLFALGGGVVGDLTGFAAACYMRGISYVQVPTTLLAQVDSSVGGKTGINHPLGKNLIGAFHQPSLVVIDVDVLDTLPQREFIAGMAEVIKCAFVADASFVSWLEANLAPLLARNKPALDHAIRRCCEIKAAVVADDEREAGRRAILNFGHTFGHAIEAGLGYGTWLHGEGVGCGMVMAADLSRRLGLVDASVYERLERIVARAGLPTRGPALGEERYLELMRLDKKSEGGAMRFVVLDGVGHATLRSVAPDLVASVIQSHTE